MGQAQGPRLGVAMASSTICVSPTGVSLSPEFVQGSSREVHFGCCFESELQAGRDSEYTHSNNLLLPLRTAGPREGKKVGPYQDKPTRVPDSQGSPFPLPLH